jgi:hypothetical protein
MMDNNFLYRVKVAGQAIHVCASEADLPRTARRCDSVIRSVIPGRKGQVWVKYFRCEGKLYATPYNGLEARNL